MLAPQFIPDICQSFMKWGAVRTVKALPYCLIGPCRVKIMAKPNGASLLLDHTVAGAILLRWSFE